MKFDSDKSYSVLVWDMPVAVFDNELDDYIRNEDGTVSCSTYPTMTIHISVMVWM